MEIVLNTEDEGLKCPVCKHQAMSREEKLRVAPADPRPCVRCGVLLRPSWSSALLLLAPVAVALVGLLAVNPSLPWWTAAILGLTAWLFVVLRYWVRIPLVVAKRR